MKYLSWWIFPFVIAAFVVDSLNTRVPQLGDWLCGQEWFIARFM